MYKRYCMKDINMIYHVNLFDWVLKGIESKDIFWVIVWAHAINCYRCVNFRYRYVFLIEKVWKYWDVFVYFWEKSCDSLFFRRHFWAARRYGFYLQEFKWWSNSLRMSAATDFKKILSLLRQNEIHIFKQWS